MEDFFFNPGSLGDQHNRLGEGNDPLVRTEYPLWFEPNFFLLSNLFFFFN